jgi:hypothetical protein
VFPHPVHVSITTIEYSSEKKGFVLGFKIFYDDLQATVLNRYQEKLNFETDKKTGNEICDRFIRDVFTFSVNGKDYSKKLKYVHAELMQEAMWIYFILPFRDKINEMEIDHHILIDLYPDQKNLLIVKLCGFEKGYTLDRNNTECRIKL